MIQKKKEETIDVIFVTPIHVSGVFQANSVFLTSTKIIGTKKKIQKTTSYFRHGIVYFILFFVYNCYPKIGIKEIRVFFSFSPRKPSHLSVERACSHPLHKSTL